MQTTEAREAARWQTGQAPDILDAFPAQELIREETRGEPRDWPGRWAEAGGSFYDGRMIALKSDPIWEKISRFGRPWPPFDFGSGMGLRDIDRDEAEAMGLIKPGEPARPLAADFNAKLEASVPEATPALLKGFKQIFGDQVAVSGDRIRWVPDALDKTYTDAVAGENLLEAVNLGRATSGAIAIARRDLGIDLEGWTMQVRAMDVRHALKEHGPAGLINPVSGEGDPTQVPLTRADLRAVPLVWRMPDRMVSRPPPAHTDTPPAGFPGSIRIQGDIAGQLWIVDYYANSADKVLGFKTAWRKRP